MSGLQFVFGQSFQIPSILALAQMPSESEQPLAVDIAHMIGDLLNAGDLEALAHLDRAYELGRFEQGFVVPVSNQAQPRPSFSTVSNSRSR